MNAEAIYNGQRGVDPDKRVFLLTRSGFAGPAALLYRHMERRHQPTRWEDMESQISAG